ncbi:MAG: glycosyltransferase [Methanobacterium sp.]|nr:glycosyltransferase [Methanobacterium sp.]
MKYSGVNPLAHYVFYGQNGRRIFKSIQEDVDFDKYSNINIDNILLALVSGKIVIILYICNDFDNIKKCISSILKNTKINYELIVINDCSTDIRVNDLLNSLDNKNNLTIRQNTKKLGFSRSVNEEIKNSLGDVLLIKSNIIVTNKWLQKMIVTAYSNETVGTVIPLFVPVKIILDTYIEIIDIQKLGSNEIAFLLETISEHLKSEINCVDESCIFIKRKVINDIGPFNEEDIDFTPKYLLKKCSDNGWKNIIEESTYVYKNIKSYDPNNPENIETSQKIKRILEKIPPNSKEYEIKIPKIRLLYVLHEKFHGLTGGTGQTTKDILEQIDKQFECYILTSTGKLLILWKNVQNRIIMLKSWKIQSKWSAVEFYNDEFKHIYFKILIGLNIDLIHIQHLLRHTPDLHKVAKILGIPIILSLHDFYYICPSINLLKYDNCYCEIQCKSQLMQCNYPVQIFDELPILKDIIYYWRKEWSILIENCADFTAPTKYTKDLYISVYPELMDKNFRVIEHGRDIKKTSLTLELPTKNKPIKILVPGVIKNHKGHDFIKELIECDDQNLIEFHFMGIIYDDLKKLVFIMGDTKEKTFVTW